MKRIETSSHRAPDGVGESVASHEGPPGPRSVLSDVGTPFDGEPCDCHELEGDGILDLSMKFETTDVAAALQLNDLKAGTSIELIVSGNLTDGTLFVATDCIRLVPPAESDRDKDAHRSHLGIFQR